MNDVAADLAVDGIVSFFKKDSDDMPLYTKVFLGVAAVAVIAYLSYSSYKKNKELSKAKHERDVLEEELKHKELEVKLVSISDEIEKKLEEIETLNEQKDRLDEKILKIEEEHGYERARIGAIKNWKDMDSYLASLRTDVTDSQS